MVVYRGKTLVSILPYTGKRAMAHLQGSAKKIISEKSQMSVKEEKLKLTGKMPGRSGTTN